VSIGPLGNGRTAFHPGRRRRATGPVDAVALERARGARARRWARRAQLRKVTSLRRVRNCGIPTSTEAGPTLAVTENPDETRTAGFGGLASCGSVWCCPQCAAKVATRRADELATVMRAVHEHGGSAFMVTFTMRHDAGDRLGLCRDDRARLRALKERAADRDVAKVNGWDVDERAAEAEAIEADTIRGRRGCWDAVGEAWHAVTGGRHWQQDQDRFGGLLGWARVVEVTDGAHGWHVHVHALLCFGDDVSAEIVEATVGARMFRRWRTALARAGFSASEEHGWDVRKIRLLDGDLADYFTKIAHEVTGAHRKENGERRGGRTPMQLLADAVDTYRVEELARWWEWESASQGRRQLTWSRGRRNLRALAGLGVEQDDQQIAEEDFGDDQRLAIDRDAWDWISTTARHTELLDVTDAGGLDGARHWLARHALGWSETSCSVSSAGP